MKRTRFRFAAVAVLAVAAHAAASSPPLPRGVVLFDAGHATWVDGGGPGSVRAPVYGDPGESGPYLHLIKVPPDRISRAHAYSDDRTYTIVSGTWYVGFGDTFDAAALTALPAGSYYALPAGVVVYTATKADGAVIQIRGTGPSQHFDREPVDATMQAPTR